MRDAGAAMSRAKAAGGARYELFDAAISRRMVERLELEDDLRHALERDELELYYQPLVDLDERRIVAVEGLVRWRHPRQGVVLPGRVHDGRRGERPDRPARAAGCCARPAASLPAGPPTPPSTSPA